jgi:hypothetical protein
MEDRAVYVVERAGKGALRHPIVVREGADSTREPAGPRPRSRRASPAVERPTPEGGDRSRSERRDAFLRTGLESHLQPTVPTTREVHPRLDPYGAEAPLSASDAPVLEGCHRSFDLAPLAVQELDPIGVVEELGRQGEAEAHDPGPRPASGSRRTSIASGGSSGRRSAEPATRNARRFNGGSANSGHQTAEGFARSASTTVATRSSPTAPKSWGSGSRSKYPRRNPR